jgi:hypothetical protein
MLALPTGRAIVRFLSAHHVLVLFSKEETDPTKMDRISAT